MAHTNAARKALRKANRANERNRAISKKLKELRKQALKVLEVKDIKKAQELYRALQKAVDKAAKRGGFIKKNTAARMKSRLAARIKASSSKK